MHLSVIENEPSEYEINALALKSKVDNLVVSDQSSYDIANAINAEAHKLRKAFHAWFDPIDEASKKQRQTTIAQGKKIDEPIDHVIKVTGSKAGAWIYAEQERAAEEKRRIEAIARKEAEDAQLRAAEALHAEGFVAAAEAALEEPVVIPKIEVTGPAKAEGVYYTYRYSAEVTDLMALVNAVAEGKVSISAVCANEAWLNKWAHLTRGTETIRGVRVVKTTTQSRRMV